MNERIRQLATKCANQRSEFNGHMIYTFADNSLEKFAELIVKDITENLSFHGHDDAVSQIQWHAANKYGLK